jgi:capsular exopolysaccharide synthesis family protein
MAKERIAPDGPTSNPSLELVPASKPADTGGAGWSLPLSDGVPAPDGVDLARYMHSLRRRWLVIVVVALPLSAAATYAARVFMPRQYVAAAVLRIATSDKTLVFETADANRGLGNSFDIYKRTQRQLLRSRYVLIPALRDRPDGSLAELPVFRNEPDPIAWLETHVDVLFPDDSEVMHVSLSAANPEGLDRLVNGIVEAYFDNVVHEEGKLKKQRLDSLKEAHAVYELELQEKHKSLNRLKDQLKEQLGTGDSKTLTPSQELELEQYGMLRSQANKISFELRQARAELTAREGANDGEIAISEFELLEAMRGDRKSQELKAFRDRAEDRLQEARKRLGPGASEQKLAPYREPVKSLDEKIETRKGELREELVERKRGAAIATIDSLKSKLSELEHQERATDSQLRALHPEARGQQTPFSIKQLESDVAAGHELLRFVGAEIERTRIELQPANERLSARVTLLSKANPARVADAKSRISKIIGAGIVAFLLPVALIVWLDARRRCINSGEEIVAGLGLSIIGTVPMIPSRIMRRLGGDSAKQQYWRTLLSESVDSIAAVLLRGAGASGIRVVMVSSATAGEGKTTLAANLATSLAGAGRRTVLVDFDLRRPALHRLFDLSLQPGINDLLREPDALATTIQVTEIRNLAFLAAGRWTSTGLVGLAGADLKSLFERLQAEYEFVVVDGSPILPIVDTRLIAQNVDTVVLSVIRDVSRAPLVRATCELLQKFNVPIFGVVVTGSRGDAYSDSSYQKYATAKAV